MKDEIGEITNIIQLEALDSYSLCALVITDGGSSVIDLALMKEIMKQHLSGGLKMIEEKVGKRRGLNALKEVAELLPI